jgi:hypothetical protein
VVEWGMNRPPPLLPFDMSGPGPTEERWFMVRALMVSIGPLADVGRKESVGSLAMVPLDDLGSRGRDDDDVEGRGGATQVMAA